MAQPLGRGSPFVGRDEEESPEKETPELESLMVELRAIRCDFAEEAQRLYQASERLSARKTGEGMTGEERPEPRSYTDHLRDELDALRMQLGAVSEVRRHMERVV